MSWSGFHERTAFIDAVVERAQNDPGRALLFELELDYEELGRTFGSLDEFLLALQQRWLNHVTAKLDQGVEEGSDPMLVWRELAAQHSGLRTLIDVGSWRSARLRHAIDGELALLNAVAQSLLSPAQAIVPQAN